MFDSCDTFLFSRKPSSISNKLAKMIANHYGIVKNGECQMSEKKRSALRKKRKKKK